MANDLVILYETDEDLRFEAVDRNCFQIFARHKGHALYIQPTMEDAKKIRDWLQQIITESEE